jgi:hypothetical protein
MRSRAAARRCEGGRRSHDVNVGEDLWFTVRKLHKIGVGGSVSGGVFRGDERRNQNGTFTFASLDMFAAGMPTTFTERIIVNPPSSTRHIARIGTCRTTIACGTTLLLNLGIRGDAQSHLSQPMVVSPRLGLNWTIIPSRKTAIRASAGMFRQGYDAGIYEQTILVNGVDQRDIVIANPGYPDPFSDASHRHRRGRRASSARARISCFRRTGGSRWVSISRSRSAGFARRTRGSAAITCSAVAISTRQSTACVPIRRARNITELETTARAASRSLELDLQLKYPRRRVSTNFTYTLGSAWNETDGPFQLPPNSLISQGSGGRRGRRAPPLQRGRERGSVERVPHHRSFRALSASPYTITTGFDTNGDGVNDERPEGVGRNGARATGTQNVDATITWGRGFGQRAIAGRSRRNPVRRQRRADHAASESESADYPLRDFRSRNERAEPGELPGLQRRAHVTILRPSDVSGRRAPIGPRHAGVF